MCEPLINKIMKEKHDDIPVSGFEHFSKDDVESAVKGIIKYHEDNIESIISRISELEIKNDLGKSKVAFNLLMAMLYIEYESIMAIEYWLEDAL